MALSSTTERPPAPSLFVSLRSFVGVVLATFCTRFDLATVELEEQATYGARLVGSTLAAVLCGSTALFFLMLLILAIFWDYRVLVLSIILGIYVIGAITFGLIARALLANRPKLLEHTLAELRKDAAGLRKPFTASGGQSL